MNQFDLPPDGRSFEAQGTGETCVFRLAVVIALVLWLTGALSRQCMAAEVTEAVLLEIEGNVMVSRSGASTWGPAYTNQALFPGDRMRTLERSRAVIRLSDLSLLRLSELTHIQLPEPTNRRGGIHLQRGLFYYFHRDKPGVMPVTTPTAYAVVLGTEFTVEVTDDDSTRLNLIEGVVGVTNEVGGIEIRTGEAASVNAGSAPTRAPALNAQGAIQWVLYYPGVLDPDELQFPDADRSALKESLDAYRSGDVRRALMTYPAGRQPAQPWEQIYLAALLLSVGQTREAERLLSSATANAGAESSVQTLAAAVQRTIAAVQFTPLASVHPGRSATALLGDSYVAQSRSDLIEALALARSSVELSPDFGFGWARVAELEFSFGRTARAHAAVQRATQLAPRNAQGVALQGFLLAGHNNIEAALAAFDRAIALDGALGNAWFGRGLSRIRNGDVSDGLEDLQVAATLEPQRAIFRSYLGKGFALAGDWPRATNELRLARSLDSLDPTAWLYSALLNQQLNRVNRGINDLEHSLSLNQQRSVFRSTHLLDQDRAVRSANLAALYRDAGMTDVSVHEAARAVNSDYANYSAHAFLAQSFNERRDPDLVNLRYETVTFSEYLLANLLAPVGGTVLSPQVSQQEYSRLFERDRLGLSSATDYASDGSWAQSASQFGTIGNVGYALDVNWRSHEGHRPNNDLSQFLGSGQFKFQLTPQDSVYVQAAYSKVESGDMRQFADEAESSRTLQVEERQEPNVFAGYHHQWALGVHTLFLGAWLDDTLVASEPNAFVRTLLRDGSGTLNGQVSPEFSEFGLAYHSKFNAGSAELQQILQVRTHTVIAGLRYQSGEVETEATLGREPTSFPPIFTDPAAAQAIRSDLKRGSAYLYDQWKIVEPFTFVAGLSYDALRYPENADSPPIDDDEKTASQISPKIGFNWLPSSSTTLRGGYTRSLGGLYYDNSVRLEPTQLAGFVQSYRSLIPESVAGLVPGTRFETFHLGLEHKFPTRTYAVVEAEWLRSEGTRTVGVFDYTEAPPFLAVPSSTRQRLDFDEPTLTLSVNQLAGEEWAFGGRYRLSAAELKSDFPAFSSTAIPDATVEQRSLLHELKLFAIWQNAAGFFARSEGVWRVQDNDNSLAPRADENFWQFHLLGGYRFAKRRAELTVGVLNLFDQDHHLNPLNAMVEPARERTFVASFKFNF
jgi:tetratricopeptide (TPR) repeat protein